jgi:phosphate/sulfate permease
MVLAALLQLMIAGVHAHNRYSGAIAMFVSSTAIAMSMLLVVANSSPFSGYYSVSSKVLQEIR